MGEIKNILLTGGTGFLGSHLLKKLLQDNYDVIVLKRSSSSVWRIKDYALQVTFYDINDDTNFKKIINDHKIDAIIHAATNYQDKDLNKILQTNIIFPVKLLDAAQNSDVKLFINTDTFFTKNVGYSYLNRYSVSKQILTTLLQQYQHPVIVNLRLEHVFGERDSKNKFVTYLIEDLINNKPVIDFTEGTQERDFIYIDDVVDAYLKTITQFKKFNGYQSFEIGRGSALSIRSFVEKAHAISGSASVLRFGQLPQRAGEFTNSTANTEFRDLTGWTAQTDIESALKRLIEDYQINKQ
jgi:nucleoside-diphosphate-sugar epimerase